nr:ribonuclease H-like domain-containing protein [Tanacetum cinerariifolium]
DNFILTLKQKLKQAETERDDLKLKFKNVQSSSKIGSQTNNKHSLGYLSSEDDCESVSLTCPSDRLSPSGGYHAVRPPITGNFMPTKPDLVFNTALLAIESDHSAFNVQVSLAKPAQTMSHITESMAPIIEDWVSDSEDESESNDPQSVSVQPIEVPILAAILKPTIKTSSSGNPKGGKISGKGKIKTGKLDFEDVYFVKELKFNLFSVSQMCDKKDKVLFTDSECLVLSPDFKLPDESQATIDESNLWHRRLGHINFKTINKLVKGTGPTWLFDIDSLTKTMNYQPVTVGNQTNPSASFQDTFDADKAGKEANLQYVLFPVWSTGFSNPHNKEGDTAFDDKEHDAEKPESAVNLSPSRSALSGEKDDTTKKKDKGKSPIECFLEYRDLNVVFEDFSKDSSNDVSAASLIVPTARQYYSNSTNSISATGP